MNIVFELFDNKLIESLECFINIIFDKLDKKIKDKIFQLMLKDFMNIFYDSHYFFINNMYPQYKLMKILIKKGIDFNQYKKYHKHSIIFDILNESTLKNINNLIKIIDLLINYNIDLSSAEYYELINYNKNIEIFMKKHFKTYINKKIKTTKFNI